jgi:hypothetical protein
MQTSAIVLGVVLAAAGPALAKKPPACPGGRYLVTGPLVPGGAAADAVVVNGTQVSIESGCPAITAKQKLMRLGTALAARWNGCGSLKGTVRLTVLLDGATCTTLTGRFINRGARINRKLDGRLDMPAGAFGGPRDALPPGAVVVSQEEWNRLQTLPDFHSIDRGQMKADEAAEARRDVQDEQTVMAFVNGDGARGGQYLGGVDPNDSAVKPADGGNFAHTFTDGTGAARTVITHGKRFFRRVAAGGLRTYPTKNNQLGLYGHFYAGLQAIDPALVGNLPPPSTAGTLTLRQILDLNAGLISNVGQYLPLLPPPGGTPPPGYPSSCGAEEGAGDGTDRSGSQVSCATHKAHGVYANMPWPLKFLTTCVKDQANRGTCWDFATTGAVELWVAKKYNRWVNLSEQHMNDSMKTIWYPAAYGDGEWPGHALAAMIVSNLLPDPFSIFPAYSYPFEDQWDYNPSNSRTADDNTHTYTNSCVGYGGDESAYCSNTAAQGRIVCTTFLFITYCGMTGPPITTTSGFYPTSYSEIWNGSNPSSSLATIFWALAIFQKPVIYAFSVPPSFNPDANGYVHYAGPHCSLTTNSMGKQVCTPAPGCECDRGGHAVLVNGLVDNTQLPAGAPPGSGGGYLIIKNSWSNCYGDAGYAYLPYDWVKAYALAVEVVGDIN